MASKELTPESPQWEVNFDRPGEYVFKGKAFNVEGTASENPCEAVISINFPPSVKLECRKCQGSVGKVITLDASGSVDPDGRVVQVDFEIVDEVGNIVDRFTNTVEPFTFQPPVEILVWYANARMADSVDFMPSAERLDGKTIRFVLDDYLEAFGAFRASIYIAGAVST